MCSQASRKWWMLLVLGAVLALAGGNASAVILVQDDFNDNSLDGSVWTTNTAIPQGGASVTEVNQRIELVSRGHLLTVNDYDPSPTALSGLRVEGEWTFANLGGGGLDSMQILTRSDGIPAGTYGETQNGIEFSIWSSSTLPGIGTKGGSLNIASVVQHGSLSPIAQGDVFNVDILDGGRNLYFRLTEVGNPSNTAAVTARITGDTFAQDRVVFHNREGGGHTAHLDNAQIMGMQSVPERDNFDDNAMDLSKWTTNTSIPQGGASVVEQNGRMELTSRGHLVSFREFNPDTSGGLIVRGQWTFANRGTDNYDFFQVLTRSDGIPSGSWGETANGIEFQVAANGGANQLDIQSRGAFLAIGSEVKTGTVTINQGDVFDFFIFDKAGNLTFTMTEVGDLANTATVTALVTADSFAQDFVVFHNREGNVRVAYLDNVSLVFSPEPGTMTLLAIGGIGALVRRRRRR